MFLKLNVSFFFALYIEFIFLVGSISFKTFLRTNNNNDGLFIISNNFFSCCFISAFMFSCSILVFKICNVRYFSFRSFKIDKYGSLVLKLFTFSSIATILFFNSVGLFLYFSYISFSFTST